MTRTILVLAVIGAFVLGSIATGTIAFAQDGDEGGGPPEEESTSIIPDEFLKVIFIDLENKGESILIIYPNQR